MIKAILAMNELRTIGHNNTLPWHCPEDLARFKRLTLGQTVIMGRKTWESLPEAYRPLPGRLNIVISSGKIDAKLKAGQRLVVAKDLQEALTLANNTGWVIGGAGVFKEALPYISEVELTVLTKNTVDGDVKLPEFEEGFYVKGIETLNREEGVYAYTYAKKKK
jgi:dihydrofolate reductase